MRNTYEERGKALALFFVLIFSEIFAQLPCNVLVGYWQSSWGTYVRLKDASPNYNVFCLAFAGSSDGTPNTISFTLYSASDNNITANLKADIKTVQAQGKLVLMSIGGSAGSFQITSLTEKNTFVAKIKNLITTYELDGIDIDIEDAQYIGQTGTISSPSAHITYLIQGIQDLMSWYQTTYGKKMILTMAPECVYTTGGLSQFQIGDGVPYLAIIEALKNEIDILQVQLYNAYQSNGLNNVTYNEATADFIVSQTEALIRGFTAKGGLGVYSGLPASKVAIALPVTDVNVSDAGDIAAGSGYLSFSEVNKAVNYLMGKTNQKPGSYTLVQSGGYPNLLGMMGWSLSFDKKNNWAYANNYASLFGSNNNNCTVASEELESTSAFILFPNPTQGMININSEKKGAFVNIYNALGEKVTEQVLLQGSNNIDLSALSTGVYIVNLGTETQKLIIQ